MTAARIRPYQRRRRGPLLVVVSVLAHDQGATR